MAEFDNFDRLSNLPKEKLLIFPFRRLGDDLSASRDVEFFRRTALTAKRRLVKLDVKPHAPQLHGAVTIKGKLRLQALVVLRVMRARSALLAEIVKRLPFGKCH